MILLVFRRIVDCGGGGGLRKGGNKQYALKFLELHVDYNREVRGAAPHLAPEQLLFPF